MARMVGLLVLGLGVVTGDARANGYVVPVYVAVVGSGQIRLLVTAGNTVPCDSSANTRIIENRVEASRTFVVQSPSSCVCETHTTGAFRETHFTPPRVVCQQIDP